MKLRARVGGVCVGLALVLGMGLVPTSGQTPSEEPKKTETTVIPKSARRVPPYFAKVGVSTEQREKIYAIRAKHQAKIADLKRQIDDAERAEMDECESVLLDSQKKLLEQFRTAAGRSRTKGDDAPKKSE